VADPLAAAFTLTLDAVSSPYTKRQYGMALAHFMSWRITERHPFSRAAVMAWRSALEAEGLAPATINQRLAAVRKLAQEAHANGCLGADAAAAIQGVPGVPQRGTRTGNWLSQAQSQALLEAPEPKNLKGKRDRAILATLLACGLRRSEASALTVEHLEQREGRWVIIDIRGKHGRIRSIPVPNFVKAAIDSWTAQAGISTGRIFRGMNRHGRITHDSLSGTAILNLAAKYGAEIGVTLKAHDLRRTCAKLCRKHGGELEQIQLLLGHAGVETTERYLGTKQDLVNAPNDRLGLKWRGE